MRLLRCGLFYCYLADRLLWGAAQFCSCESTADHGNGSGRTGAMTVQVVAAAIARVTESKREWEWCDLDSFAQFSQRDENARTTKVTSYVEMAESRPGCFRRPFALCS